MKVRCFGRICMAIAVAAFSVTSLHAQSGGEQKSRDDGWQLRSVGVSGDYFHQAVPPDITTFGDVFLGTSQAVSATANVGYRHSSKRSFAFLSSESVYGVRSQNGTQKNWNEAVLGDAFTKHGRWSFGGSGSAAVMNFDQALFANSTLSELAASPSGFQDLATAVTHGQIDSPALANGGRFEADAAASQFLLGRRMTSVGGQGTTSYSWSRRSGITVSGGSSLVRHLNDGTDTPGTFVPSAKTVSVTASYIFSPSRRTEMSAATTYSRSTSQLLESTGRTVTLNVNHSMRRLVFYEGSIGGGTTTGAGNHSTILFSGGGGLKFRTHSVMALYNRDLSRIYSVALGYDSTFFSTATLAWYWNPRRAPWYASVNYSHFRDQPPGGVRAPTSWLSRQTFGTHFGGHYSLVVDYSIARTGARRYIINGHPYSLEQNAVRVSVNWSPRNERGRR